MCNGASSQTVSEQLGELTAGAQALLQRELGATGEETAEQLIRTRHLIDLLELRFAHLSAVLHESRYWHREGSLSASEWIRHNCKTSGVTAQRAVMVGEQAASVPKTMESVAAGRAGYGHLVHMAQTVADIRLSRRDNATVDETPLLELAEQHSVGRFMYDCRTMRHALDAEGAREEQRSAIERRSLNIYEHEGMVVLSGAVDPAGGAVVRTALEALAKPSGQGDTRYRERRLADALIEVCNHRLDLGDLPQRNSQAPHLQVTATVETLVGLSGAPAGSLEFSLPITSETVQRLACSSTLIRTLLDSKSQVIDVGRARRTPPVATLRAVRARDERCIWPGCDRSSSWTTAHHVEHWALHFGPSDVANLCLLCYRHHEMVHEGGWMLTRTEEGVIVTPPLGRYVPPWGAPDGRSKRERIAEWQALGVMKPRPDELPARAPDTDPPF